MNKLPVLTPRLALVASFVRNNVKVVDIGTDHAYIPVWLTLSNICSGCIAADIKSGPLGRAENTVKKYNADHVKLRLSDGLYGILPQEADDIIIAGMGGELIISIIESCEWLMDSGKHLILQPMTAQDELRKGLYEHGFEILCESVAKENNKLYVVMTVQYCGVKFTPDKKFCIVGSLFESDDELAREYIANKIEKLKKKAAGLSKAKVRTAELSDVEDLLSQFKIRSEESGGL
jgi:tRNA (adenine22-N1)-methyltransferase